MKILIIQSKPTDGLNFLFHLVIFIFLSKSKYQTKKNTQNGSASIIIQIMLMICLVNQ
jgi:hypothetical protein